MNNNKANLPITEIIERRPAKRRGEYTREEINSQPEAWSDAVETLRRNLDEIRDFRQNERYEQVIFTGCGSTYYLSLGAARIFQEVTGVPARGLPASELWLNPGANYHKHGKTLLVAVSRSGETSETLQACEEFRNRNRGKIMTLVCKTSSPLTEAGDLNLLFPSGMEKSVAQTRAFSTLYLAATGVSAIWAEVADPFEQLDKLPQVGRKIIAAYLPLAEEFGRNLEFDRIYNLGSGGRLGLANELCLKMKEMSLTHSEAFHFLEFRHGPKAMVNQQTLVVGLVSETNSDRELAVLSDIEQLGGKVLSLGENDTDIVFRSNIKEVYRNVLFLPFGQMLAFERSIAKGLDPDRPTNLDAVVKLTN